MRGSGEISTFLFVLLCTVAGLAQSSSQPVGTADSVKHSRSHTSSLVARSEMQRPKPIPSVNSLRLEQIPAAVMQGENRPNADQPSEDTNKPALAIPAGDPASSPPADLR
jgi:hypothetical protein